MSEEQVGERRRRREAERAAREAEGGGQERPLTRRELRARETAIATGALELDSTGEIRVIRDEGPTSTAADEPPPVTGSIGLTRRELRALREQQAAVSSTPPRGLASPSSASSAISAASGADAVTPSPSAGALPSPPRPPVRRPVVRPPSSATVRGLAEDGTGLGPAVRSEQNSGAETSGPASWTTAEVAAIDVTDDRLVAPAEPKPSPARSEPAPVSRRSVRPSPPEPAIVDEAASTASSTPVPSIDEVIAGEAVEPEPFDRRPAWPELPPPTPSGPMPVVEAEVASSAAPEQPAASVDATEVMPTQRTDERAPSVPVSVDDGNDEDDEPDADHDHGTPLWLTLLMVLVLIVIGIVLGLLVFQVFRGGDVSTAAPAAWMGMMT